MIGARYLVTTTIRGRFRHQVWNVNEPLRLGWNLGWELSDDPAGAKLVADGGGSQLTIQKAQLAAPLKVRVQPPGAKGVEATVEIKPLKVIRPGYVPEKNTQEDTSTLRLYSFQGVRGWFLTATRIEAAYIGFSRGRPVFSIRLGPDSAEIKCLLPGMKIKMSGQSPLPGEVGEKWTIKRDKLPNVTLMRGLYWWRFHWFRPHQTANAAEMVKSLSEVRSKQQDNQFLVNLGAAVALTVATIGGLMHFGKAWLPKAAPVEVEIAEKPLLLPAEEPAKVVEQPVTQEPVKVASDEDNRVAEPPKPKPPERKAPPPKQLEKIPPVQKPGNTAEAQTKSLAQSYANILGTLGKKTAPTSGAAPVAAMALKNTNTSAGLVSGAVAAGAIPVGSAKVDALGAKAQGGGYASGSGDNLKVQGQGSSILDGAGDSASVAAGLKREEVAAVIRAHMKEVRFCHEMAMTKQAKVEGRIVIDFVILAAGNVGTQKVSENTSKSTDLEQCLMKRLGGWTFPKPKNMNKVSVQYPFEFRMLAVE